MAICYKIEHGIVEYSLVKTSKKRFIFPKGKIFDNEPRRWAERYAEEEGGIIGRIENSEKFSFTYVKAGTNGNGIQNIDAYLVRATNEKTIPAPEVRKRNPKWFSYEKALDKLIETQSSTNGTPLRQALEWAKKQIDRPDQHQLAGVLPYRIAKNGLVEILIVTSKQ